MIELDVVFTRKLFGLEGEGISCFAAEPTADYRKHVSVDKRYGTFSVTGDFFIKDSELGRVFTIVIEEDLRAKYPNSYRLIQIKYELPLDAEAQWDYLLKSGLVTMTQYLSMKDVFAPSDKIIDIICDEKERILDVHGFGEAYARSLNRRVVADRGRAIIYNRYGEIDGVGPSIITSIVRWKPDIETTLSLIDNDPFCLMEIEGVGFIIADNFRSAMGIPLDDKSRCLHGISYYVNELLQGSGDTYALALDALSQIQGKLNVDKEVLLNYLLEKSKNRDELVKYNLFLFSKFITTHTLFTAERIIKSRVENMKSLNMQIVETDEWNKIKEEVLEENSYTLSTAQNEFLDKANDNRISLLIGAGGSGKSWVTNILCTMLRGAGKTYALFAPTARAASIMTGYIGTPAETIHRGLLQLYYTKEKHSADVIIVDEASMIDSELMSIVLETIKPAGRIVIIGDDFQLPSVSPGNVLFDMINNLDVTMTKLTKVFRQENESNILKYANQLKDETFKLDSSQKEIDMGDISFINTSNDQETQNECIRLYHNALKSDSDREIMLLTPVNKGVIGRAGLNKEIQKLVNPNGETMVFGKNLKEEDQTYFRRNDLIAIRKNDYNRTDIGGDPQGVINSDVGEITQADDDVLIIKVNGNSFFVERDEVFSLMEHAWSLTVHKAQGGQANQVIIAIPRNGAYYLSANMLYTAITRAKVNVVIVGPIDVLNKSAKRFVNFERKTILSLAKSKGE